MGMTGCALCIESGQATVDVQVKGSDPFPRFFFAIKQLLPFSYTDADCL